MTLAAAWLGTVALVGLTAQPIARRRAEKRAKRQARIAEENELGQAMWQANVDGFGRLGRSANR